MKFAFFWIVLAGLICLAERRWIYFPFAIASLLFLTGVMFLFVGNPFKAALLAALFAVFSVLVPDIVIPFHIL
ncbi:MAG: hypothetical protein ACR2O0_04845 [Rhizobiaceae bacterium]